MTTPLTDSRHVDVPTLKQRLADGSAPRVLDVRTPAEFETAHIPGSYNVPLDSLREHRDELRRHLDEDVVLVCRSGNRAAQAEKALAEVGLPGLRVLEGGILGWQSSGGPLTRGRETWELERQVRLVAGAIVALSILGSLVVPGLQWLAFAIGSGLVFAAVSNTCAMGMMLSKLPWNRGGAACEPADLVAALAERR